MKRGLKGQQCSQVCDETIVATYAPMKRGLKDPDPDSPDPATTEVATYAPMKRGLKANVKAIVNKAMEVATYAPMKRGLKVSPIHRSPTA